ncbi:MAG: hypothetical protein ACI31M_03585 [Bacilli bacterium]
MAADQQLLSKERELLQRVYDLRGEDSVIIKKHHDLYETLNESKASKEESKKKLEDENRSLEIEMATLKEQGDEFVKAFQGFSRETYSVILEKLNISFDPQEMVAKVEKEAPEQIALMEKTLTKKKEEVEELGNQILKDESDIKEANINLEQAEKDQKSLNNIIESALEGNKEITTSQVEELFKKGLQFNDADTEEIETIIIVKQNKLRIFDEDYKRSKLSLDEQNVNEVEVNDYKTLTELIAAQAEEDEKDKENKITDETVEKTEIINESTKEQIVDGSVEQLGINASGLTNEEIEIINNADPITVANNLKIINEIGAEIKENILALVDSELSAKIDILYGKGKKPQDIKFALDVIANLKIEDINSTISKIEALGLKVGDLPLEVIRNVEKYIANVNELTNHNVVPDSKELSSHSSSLAAIEPEIYRTNLDIMTNAYGVNCHKANNKIAFETIAQTTKSLVGKVDLYIEAGEPEVLTIGADLLAKDAIDVLSRIELIKTLGVEYKTPEKYKTVLTSPSQLEKIIGKDEIPVTVPTQDENNENLKEIINSEECVNKLLDAQANNDFYGKHVCDEATYSTFAKIVEDASASSEEDMAYLIADTRFSKKKFKRNLEWMLENISDATTEQIIMTALATNSNKTEEDLKKVVEALGFNLAMGGK